MPRASGILLLFLAAFTAFLPSLAGDFLLDDKLFIVYNETLRAVSQWPRLFYDPASFFSDPTLAHTHYRPVTGLSFALNYWLAGPDPFWFHVVNALLHAANTCLVLLLAVRLLGAGWHCWFAALLFCLHPAQAQGVSYISARSDLLCAFFLLTSFILYLDAGAGGSGVRRKRRVFLGVFLLALLSKGSAIFLVPVLAAYDWVRRPASEAWRARFRRWGPPAVVAAGYLALRTVLLGQLGQRGPWGGSWELHSQLAVHGMFEYLRIVFWPVALREPYGFRLSPDFLLESIGMGVVLAVLVGLTAYGVFRRRLWSFPLFWALAALAPISNVIPFGNLVADRYLYVPLAGLSLAGGLMLKGRRAGVILAACAAIVLALAPQSVEQQLHWRSDFVLASEAVSAAPGEPYAGLRLAVAYVGWRMYDRAEALSLPALSSDTPPDVKRLAFKRLAFISAARGRNDDAIRILETGLVLFPGQRSLLRMLEQCRAAKLTPRAPPLSTP